MPEYRKALDGEWESWSFTDSRSVSNIWRNSRSENPGRRIQVQLKFGQNEVLYSLVNDQLKDLTELLERLK